MQFALVDTNYDGYYGDSSRHTGDPKTAHGGDLAFVDDNGFGRVVPLDYGTQGLKLKEVSKVVDKYYTISVNSLADKVTIRPYDGPMGKLLVGARSIGGLTGTADGMQVSSRMGDYSFKASPNKPVALPAGAYKIGWISLQLTDKNGHKVPIGCSLDRSVVVKDGEQASVDLGGKLSLAINPSVEQLVFKPGETTRISWYIRAGGMTFTSLGDRSPKYSPQVKFFNSAGRLLATTTAAYT